MLVCCMLTQSRIFHHARVATLLLIGGFGVMGGGLLAPALPALIDPFGVQESSVGLVLSVYTLAAALTLPFTGLLLDVLGRKPVGVACLIIDGVFGLLCTAAPSFAVLLVFRFLQGIGIAGLIPVAMTVIGDWYQGEKRLKVMGYLSATIAVAAVVIPLLGGVLAEFSWRYPFFVYGFSPLLAIAFVVLVPETAPDRSGAHTASYLRGLGKALGSTAVREVFLHSFGTFFLLYAMVTFVPLFIAARYGYGVSVAGAAISLNGLIAALVAGRAVGLNRRLGRRLTLVCGYTAIGVSLALMPFWPGAPGVVVSLVLFGIGMGVVQPAIFNWATTAGPAELTGSIVALFNTLKFIGMTAAPLVLRSVHGAGGMRWTFAVAGAVGGLWALRAAFRGAEKP